MPPPVPPCKACATAAPAPAAIRCKHAGLEGLAICVSSSFLADPWMAVPFCHQYDGRLWNRSPPGCTFRLPDRLCRRPHTVHQCSWTAAFAMEEGAKPPFSPAPQEGGEE
eukprot:GGOE01054933.1.p6 GENE.GGOE01054933.1~~GGOE01054933.1.p6  ORF type:complete len:110 (+),score=3.34 GGOE01054933.1:468-797(+)